jgi:hypothetical protein
MPFDSNGNASLVPGYLATTGQTILANQHNPPLEDIANMLSQVLLRSGVAPMSGALNMNGFRIQNLPESTNAADPVVYSQLQTALAGLAVVPTGTVASFRRTTAPSGWVKENGGTIGNASSGATTRANADTEALFTLLWNEFSNTILPIQTSAGAASTRGASAAADFAANKRMPLFDSRSRFHRGADDGLGFDTGLTVGAVQADGIKNHVHEGDTNPTVANLGGLSNLTDNTASGSVSRLVPGGSLSVSFPSFSFTTDNNTGGLALETRPRSSVVLFCIKL